MYTCIITYLPVRYQILICPAVHHCRIDINGDIQKTQASVTKYYTVKSLVLCGFFFLVTYSCRLY